MSHYLNVFEEIKIKYKNLILFSNSTSFYFNINFEKNIFNRDNKSNINKKSKIILIKIII